jgi:hypothetical protein
MAIDLLLAQSSCPINAVSIFERLYAIFIYRAHKNVSIEL